jgi:hypothetical protein
MMTRQPSGIYIERTSSFDYHAAENNCFTIFVNIREKELEKPLIKPLLHNYLGPFLTTTDYLLHLPQRVLGLNSLGQRLVPYLQDIDRN